MRSAKVQSIDRYSDNAGEVPASARPWGGLAQRSACLAGVVTGGVTCSLLRVEKGPEPARQRTESTCTREKEKKRGVRRSSSKPQFNKPNPALEGVGVARLELWPSGDWSRPRALPATHSRRQRARVSSALAKTCMRPRITPTGYQQALLQLFLPYSANGQKTLLLLAEPHEKLERRWTLPVPRARAPSRRALAPCARFLRGTCDTALQSTKQVLTPPVPMLGGSGFAGSRSRVKAARVVSLICLQTLAYLLYRSRTVLYLCRTRELLHPLTCSVINSSKGLQNSTAQERKGRVPGVLVYVPAAACDSGRDRRASSISNNCIMPRDSRMLASSAKSPVARNNAVDPDQTSPQ